MRPKPDKETQKKPVIDLMEERNWHIEVNGNTVTFTNPKRRKWRHCADPIAPSSDGRPDEVTVEYTEVITVTLGKGWHRALGKVRCALTGIAMGQCYRYKVDIVEVNRVPLWPYTPEECDAHRQNCLRAD